MGLNVSAFTDFGFKMFLLAIVITLMPESPFAHFKHSDYFTNRNKPI